MVGLQRLVVVGDARSRKANEVEEENEEGRVARTLLHSRGIFYLLRSSSFLAPFSPCPTRRPLSISPSLLSLSALSLVAAVVKRA